MSKEDKSQNQAQPWIALGITEELYKEISSNIAKDLAPVIKEEILLEMNQQTVQAENTANGKMPNFIEEFLEKNSEFKVRLSNRTGMWSSPDGSIVLSIFPDPVTKRSRSLSDVITANHPNIKHIKAAVATESLRFASVNDKQEDIAFQQLSKGASHIKNISVSVPADIRKLLNNPEIKIPGLLKDVTNVGYLKVLLNLERQAESTAGRTRPNVIAALNARIRELPAAVANSLGMGSLDYSDVTEEMPEDYKEKKVAL